MSDDASSLRSVLQKTDGSAPAIQNAASKMMRHYDKSPQVAVTEWRNCLQTCDESQLLPLLYVANEVLQNSKRNRGNKFLEAFSPILGQALQHILSRDASLTEKVRRTAKIWGDRRVFSTRYVGDLLHGLERFRNQATDTTPRFSPTSSPPSDDKKVTPEPLVLPEESLKEPKKKTKKESSSQDSDLFDDFESPSQHLNLDISLPDVAVAAAASSSSNSKKKRRQSTSTSGSTPPPSLEQQKKRRSSIMSTSGLMELWNQTSSLEQSFSESQTALNGIAPQHLSTSAEDAEQLVGDELLEGYKAVVKYQALVKKQRGILHSIATERRALEQEAVGYIGFLRGATKQDEEDLQTCAALETQLQKLKFVHAQARAARNARVESERTQKELQQQALLKKQQEEERRKLLESAIKPTESQPKPGMVWNKATQEYQYLNTDESWRD